MKHIKILTALTIILSIVFSCCSAAGYSDPQAALSDTAQYILNTVPEPVIGSTGGEWGIIGLARSGYNVPQNYFDEYYSRVEEYVKSCGGVLHERKFTEYSRLILALTAIGKNPENVAGYNLLKPLGDYDGTLIQGINGPIWALIALDCGSYEMPINSEAETQATREMYISYILSRQLPDGGFALTGVRADAKADPDITGMAVQALSNYKDMPEVNEALDKALQCLSEIQNPDGGFSSGNSENSESCVQVIVALCEMGISLEDPRFTKEGHTALDGLMKYYTQGAGFRHTLDETQTNLMASEQGLYALAAVKRLESGESSLYDMKEEEATKAEPITVQEAAQRTVKGLYILLRLVTAR